MRPILAGRGFIHVDGDIIRLTPAGRTCVSSTQPNMLSYLSFELDRPSVGEMMPGQSYPVGKRTSRLQ